MAKVKTLSEFQKIKIGDEILFDGDLYIVSDVGIHFDRNYIEISEIELGDGIDIDDQPIKGTEYKLFFSEAKNHIEIC